MPADPADAALARELAVLSPDFIFSFYYAKLLPATLLAAARRAALNMHGSLVAEVPRPCTGELGGVERRKRNRRESALHGGQARRRRARRPGTPCRLGRTITAFEVAGRVADAAVIVLERSLPRLIAGTAAAQPLNLAQGSYYGGRTPADGEFSWDWPASRIHNLVRAVARPSRVPTRRSRPGAERA